MNEVAFSLHALTGSPAHLQLATYFEKREWFAPLAAGAGDPLAERHANQHPYD